MKQCPKCDFTFADFHHVCDFDGTELVPDADQASLNVSPPSSCLRRAVKSPFFLMGLTVVGLLTSALMIGYYDSVNQPAPVVKDPSPAAPQSAFSIPAISYGLSGPTKTTASKRARLRTANRFIRTSFASPRRKPTPARVLARQHRKTFTGTRSRESETAQRSELEQATPEKEPRLTAMLKTTWRVLKRPFKF